MLSVLRDDQDSALTKLRHSLSTGHKRPLVQAPTGFGKTVLAAAIVEGALRKDKRVMFTVPAISLIDQTMEAFYSEGIRGIGVIQADHPATDYSQPIQIASAQTLARRRRIPQADLVLVDEAHVQFESYKQLMMRWYSVPFVGLSATPWSKGLGRHFDDLIIASTIKESIDRGSLSDFIAYSPDHPDLSKVSDVAGEHHQGQLSAVMNTRELVGSVVDRWMRHRTGKTFVFAVDVAHAKNLLSQFISRGVRAGYIDAFTTREEREEIRKQFHTGELELVVNILCLTTGIDWDVRRIVLATSFKSEMRFVQVVGRGLRTAEGKEYLVIDDHGSTHNNLGFVTDIHHSELCDGTKTKKEKNAEKKEAPLPKECPKCHRMKPAGVPICPECGFKPEKQADVETIPGELKQIKTASGKRSASMTDEQKAD